MLIESVRSVILVPRCAFQLVNKGNLMDRTYAIVPFSCRSPPAAAFREKTITLFKFCALMGSTDVWRARRYRTFGPERAQHWLRQAARFGKSPM